MPASEDDDDFDWGYLECEPSSSKLCGHRCDPYEPGFCPQHARRGLALGKGFVPTLEIGCEVKENANSFPKQELLTHATPTALSIEGFRLQGDRLLVGRIILVSGEIFFIFMIMNKKKAANIAQISRKSEICALFAFF